jgi:hypothetical protein
MNHFIVKASRQDPSMECSYHFDLETKEECEAAFKLLMPDYTISKVKRVEIATEEGELK